ncbi:MAG: acylphosphatase [Planctomycetota bacterium]|nr:acylphosphatase [Planctomycetota bacterium]
MDTAEPRRIHALVSGRVQGVYYRASTRDEAGRLGLRGWVRNLPDGRVELEAEGAAAQVASLVAWLYQGPPAARVDDVQVSEQAPSVNEASFEVRR